MRKTILILSAAILFNCSESKSSVDYCRYATNNIKIALMEGQDDNTRLIMLCRAYKNLEKVEELAPGNREVIEQKDKVKKMIDILYKKVAVAKYCEYRSADTVFDMSYLYFGLLPN